MRSGKMHTVALRPLQRELHAASFLVGIACAREKAHAAKQAELHLAQLLGNTGRGRGVVGRSQQAGSPQDHSNRKPTTAGWLLACVVYLPATWLDCPLYSSAAISGWTAASNCAPPTHPSTKPVPQHHPAQISEIPRQISLQHLTPAPAGHQQHTLMRSSEKQKICCSRQGQLHQQLPGAHWPAPCSRSSYQE